MYDRTNLLKSINKLAGRKKSAVKLPVPTKQQKVRDPATKDVHIGLPLQLNATHDWQIEWINQFDQSRKEANEQIKTEQLLNKKHTDRIAVLLKKNAKHHAMLVKVSKCLDKKDHKISKYKNRWIQAKEEIKSMQRECADVAINTDPLPKKIDVSTETEQFSSQMRVDMAINTDPLPNRIDVATETNQFSEQMRADEATTAEPSPSQMDVDVAADTDQFSSENQNTTSNELDQLVLELKYKCPDCPRYFDKSDNLKVHRKEFCVTPPVKDRQCKYCQKMFTRRSLRVHINNYVANQHKPTGKHRNVSLDSHLQYLAEIKAEVAKPKARQ